MKARMLSLPPRALVPPPDRGELLTAQEVAKKLFRDAVKPAWVRQHVRPMVKLGHRTVLWYEDDVKRYIDQQRSEGAA